MALKPQLDKVPVARASPVQWGELGDPGEPTGVIRFECADGAYSYPYHALKRWVLQSAEPESLVIEVGQDQVTLHGRKLEELRDALDAGRLRVIRTIEGRYLNGGAGVIVSHLKVERLNPEN